VFSDIKWGPSSKSTKKKRGSVQAEEKAKRNGHQGMKGKRLTCQTFPPRADFLEKTVVTTHDWPNSSKATDITGRGLVSLRATPVQRLNAKMTADHGWLGPKNRKTRKIPYDGKTTKQTEGAILNHLLRKSGGRPVNMPRKKDYSETTGGEKPEADKLLRREGST